MNSSKVGNEFTKEVKGVKAEDVTDEMIERAAKFLKAIDEQNPECRGAGRPRKNPIATQRDLAKFRASERHSERARVAKQKERVKADVELYGEAMVECNPDLMDALLDFALQLYDNGAAVQDSPMTPYQLRVFISQVMGRLVAKQTTPAKIAQRMERREGGHVEGATDAPVVGFEDWDDAEDDAEGEAEDSGVTNLPSVGPPDISSLPGSYRSSSPGMPGPGPVSSMPPTLPSFEDYLEGKMNEPPGDAG